MVKLLPKHNTDHSPLTRHTSLYTVDVDAESEIGQGHQFRSSSIKTSSTASIPTSMPARAVCFWWVNTSTLSRLIATKATFVSREVRIENRRLDKGSHWPI